MFLPGFSIDNISLMGLTLAVGLVVDDAIVMLENIYRHMEEDGLPAFQAQSRRNAGSRSWTNVGTAKPDSVLMVRHVTSRHEPWRDSFKLSSDDI
jgi:Cu/Ag efflux pump CusA